MMLRLARVAMRRRRDPRRAARCAERAVALQQLVRFELVAGLGGEVALDRRTQRPLRSMAGISSIR